MAWTRFVVMMDLSLVAWAALLLFTAMRGCLAFPLSAGRFVVLASPRFREDAILLNLAIESLQRHLEIITITDRNF